MSGLAKRKPVFTSHGYALTECECCREMVRDDDTEKRHEFNWVLTCAECKLRCCIKCMPEGTTVCTGCAHARATAGSASAGASA